MSPRIRLSIFLAGTLIALSLVLWWQQPAQQATALPLTDPVRIAVGSSLLTAPFFIAQAKGYFVEQGLSQVTLHRYAGGHRTMEAIFTGEADIATASDLPVMFHSFKQDDFAVLFTFVTSEKNLKIIARADTGIGAARDLHGRTIGATFGTSSHFFLKSFLLYHEIDPRYVHIRNVQPEDMLKSLEDGTIEAVASWEIPSLQILNKLKDRAIAISNPSGIYKQTFNAISSKNYIGNNREVIRRIVKSIVHSINFMRENEKEAQSILISLFPGKEDVLPDIWDNFVFEVSLDQSFVSTLEDAARWAIKNRLVDGEVVPNYLDYIYFDALHAVKPDAVRILH